MFRTPKDTPKRNYDDFEILERASFHSEDTPTPPNKNDSPTATASAQIHVKIADKRSVKEGEPPKPVNDVDETLKKLLIMLIKPLVENNQAAPGRINPFFPFPPSPHPSPPYANLLGGLSALSAISGLTNNPEAMKKAAKMVHKFKEQLKAASVENEIEDVKNKGDIPLKITLNDKPMKLQAVDGEGDEENASVADKGAAEKLVDLGKLYPFLVKGDDDEEEKPKRRKKKPKMKAIDPLEVYMRRVFTPGCDCGVNGILNNYNPAVCNCNPFVNNLLNVRPFNYDLNNFFAPKIPLLTPKIIPTPQPRPDIVATEFVVHVPVLIKNKPPPYNNNNNNINALANYPLLASLLTNYGKYYSDTF